MYTLVFTEDAYKTLTCRLIQKAEHPERNAVPIAGFYAVNRQITVRNIRNLFEVFSFAANFEKVFSINQKISLLRHLNGSDGR